MSGSQNSDQQESGSQDLEQEVFESPNLVHQVSCSQYLEKQVSGQNRKGERPVSNDLSSPEGSDLMYGSLGFQAYGELGV